jgi:prepilin-type N-terminal cleavage/methylation domain-containing protein
LKSFLKSRKRAFTLIEMVVATSILAVFIMLALGTIIPGFKITKQAEESIATQREVVLAFDRLVAEMSLLDRATVSVAADTLSFLSDKPYRGPNAIIDDQYLDDLGTTTTGRTWLKNVVLRRRNGELWRREHPYTKGEGLFQIKSAYLPLVADASGVAEKIFAKNVEEFEAITAGHSRVVVRVRSVFRDAARPSACELTVQIQMRGGR